MAGEGTPIGIALGLEAAAEFRWNDNVLQEILAGPNGPVGRDLAQRAIRVESQAKENASGRPGPNVDTGRLRSSIAWRLQEEGPDLVALVGTNVEYALYLEITGVGNAQVRYPFLVPALPAAQGDSIAQ